MKKALLGMSAAELKMLAVEAGEKGYRGRQIADLIYRQGCREIAVMSSQPAGFRSILDKSYTVGRSSLNKISSARDGTFKLLLELADGELVETVGMPYEDRFSCCVSTQAGCRVACAFCATGSSGFKCNLTAGEIVDQVLTVQEKASSKGLLGPEGRVSHVVFMGMGEPLLNYDATLRAIRLINRELEIGMRNITLSTIGYVPGIYKLAGEGLQITLAVSLHASDDALRRKLVPGMSKYRVAEIVRACRDYFKATGRRISFEYCLLRGVNDRKSDAVRLAELLKGLSCHVNLIPFNMVQDKGFKPPEPVAAAAFRSVLEQAGIAVTQRQQRGADIQAACGQLRRLSRK